MLTQDGVVKRPFSDAMRHEVGVLLTLYRETQKELK